MFDWKLVTSIALFNNQHLQRGPHITTTISNRPMQMYRYLTFIFSEFLCQLGSRICPYTIKWMVW